MNQAFSTYLSSNKYAHIPAIKKKIDMSKVPGEQASILGGTGIRKDIPELDR